MGYRTVIAAEVIYRKDCPEGGKLLVDGRVKREDSVFLSRGLLEYCKPMRFRVMRSHQTKTAS